MTYPFDLGTCEAQVAATVDALVAPTITVTTVDNSPLTMAQPLKVLRPFGCWYNGNMITAPAGGAYIAGYDPSNEGYTGLEGHQNVAVLTVDLGNVVGIAHDGYGFSLISSNVLTAVSAASLVICDNFNVRSNSSLVSLDVSALRVCGTYPDDAGTFNISGSALPSLSLPSIEYCAGIDGSFCESLTTVFLGESLKGIAVGGNGSRSVTFYGSALTQDSVDHVLARLVGLDGTNGTTMYFGATVDVSNGTNAAPSEAGAANAAILTARGCTVNTN